MDDGLKAKPPAAPPDGKPANAQPNAANSAKPTTPAAAPSAPAAAPKDDGKVDIESSKKSINILVVSTDLAFARMVQSAYQVVIPPNSENSCRIFPGVSKEKILETLAKHSFHSIIVDEEYLHETTPSKYRSEMREALKGFELNISVPLILAVTKMEPTKIRELVREGWKDIIMKPIDSSLFMQKMNLYDPKAELLKESLLFTMDAEKKVDLMFSYKAKSISEYGLKIESPREMELGTVVGLQALFFGQQLSAVVIESKKSNDGTFQSQLMFIGVTAGETQMIRRFIRQEYAEDKAST